VAKLWADWYDPVLPHLPGLPAGAPADFLIKRAAIEFFDRSLAWRVAIPAFQATIATGSYTLAAPVAGAIVVKVLELRFSGKELLPKTPSWLKDNYGPGQDWRTVSADPPTYWLSEYPNQVTIVPKPLTTTASALAGWCAVKPTDAATDVPDDIWREYFQEVADLAKARAMELPKKPYTDKAQARDLLEKIDGRIGAIAYSVSSGANSASRRVRTHWI
jgi:hypothetical protein